MSHTPGPWRLEEQNGNISTAIGVPIAIIGGEVCGETVEFHVGKPYDFGPHGTEQTAANARLVRASPDHALIAAALTAYIARWEPKTNEFCVSGMAHSTKLDEFGIPTMTSGIRAGINKAMSALLEGGAA